ncbi:MAG: DUF4139 domain-containing protein [bacterium]
MPTRSTTAASTLIVALLATAANAEISLTVYNDNLAMVRETRAIEMKSENVTIEVQDVPSQIDPTSVHFQSRTSPDRTLVLEQNFVYDLVSDDRLFERYLDKEVQVFTRQGGSFSGLLRSFAGGSIIVAAPDGGRTTLVARPEVESIVLAGQSVDLVTRPTLVWLLSNGGPSAQTVDIDYLTSGIAWHAEYAGVLDKDDKTLDLAAWVSLDNHSGKTYEDATLKVVAGSVHRAQTPQPKYFDGMARAEAAMAAPGFESRAFFEYHLYELGRKTTVRDRESKQLSLFPNARTKVEKIYTYDARRDAERVDVSIQFENRAAAGLGMALPAGVIRLYKEEAGGGVGFVGEDRIEHTPKDEEVEVVVGKAFDVVAERSQLESRALGERSREDSYEIRFRNHKTSAVEIDVKESAWGDWRVTKSSHPSTRKDASTIQFKIPVAADGETVLTYTLFTKW